MAPGKRKQQHQQMFWVAADKLGGGPRNVFYDRLNQLLGEIDFDGKIEKAAEPHYCRENELALLENRIRLRLLFFLISPGLSLCQGRQPRSL